MTAEIVSIEDLQNRHRDRLYIADRGLATSIFLALKLGRPLFLEGEAGVGKTEVAKVLTDVLATDLIRLQCYEGLDGRVGRLESAKVGSRYRRGYVRSGFEVSR
jgi:MoxR-like ATPase